MQHHLQPVHQTLAETGVETMLIKGCALFYTLPDYTLETLRNNGLLPYFAYLRDVLENEYGLLLPLPEHSSAQALCSPTQKRWLDSSLAVADAPWWDQTRAMALFALNYVSGRESWLSALGAYVSALWRGARQATYDDWPLWVQSLVDRAERGPFFARTPPQGLQVMLAPVTVELCSAWAGIAFDTDRTVRILREKGFKATTVGALDSICIRVGQDEILATPAGLFLPTRYAVFTEDQLKNLADAAERVWKAVAEESPQSSCAATRERYYNPKGSPSHR
ncbi:MAG: hypothetical protein ACOY94_18610 [Bacillota bacterium]